MNQVTHVSLFSGYGGLDIGLKMAIPNLRTVLYCEYDRYAQGVLMSRMRDGGLDPAPIWTDVRTLDGKCWRGCVDIISGGFPCQDISISKVYKAGEVGRGVEGGERSGLWFEYSRLIGEIRPGIVFIENVAMLTNRGLSRVISDLAKHGYNARWTTISGDEAGQDILRKRLFILASSDSFRLDEGSVQFGINKQWYRKGYAIESYLHPEAFGNIYKSIPDLSSMAYEPSSLLDEIKCIGNGVSPELAALAWQILSERIK